MRTSEILAKAACQDVRVDPTTDWDPIQGWGGGGSTK